MLEKKFDGKRAAGFIGEAGKNMRYLFYICRFFQNIARLSCIKYIGDLINNYLTDNDMVHNELINTIMLTARANYEMNYEIRPRCK